MKRQIRNLSVPWRRTCAAISGLALCGKVTRAAVLCRLFDLNLVISFFVLAGTRLAPLISMSRRPTIVVLAVGLTWCRVSLAQELDRPVWTGERPLAIEVGNGANSPLGWIYASVDVSPIRYFSLTAGMGYGDNSTQFSAMARLRVPGGRTSVGVLVHGLGLGWSMGRHTTSLPEPCQPQGLFDEECASPGDKVWDRAQRINMEYSIELPLVAWMLALRCFGGLSIIANSDSYYCDYGMGTTPVARCGGSEADLGKYSPYLGIGLSFLLDPWSSTAHGFPSDEEP